MSIGKKSLQSNESITRIKTNKTRAGHRWMHAWDGGVGLDSSDHEPDSIAREMEEEAPQAIVKGSHIL